MSKRKRNTKWEAFKLEALNKRQGKKDDANAEKRDYITVQRLSSSVEGKWQKYARIGPLTMVHLGCEATLENIKKECKKHFNITDMDCDILAGERGPSYTDISQITNWKVLHIRFVARSSESCHESEVIKSSPVKCQQMSKYRRPEPSKVPASVPLSALLDIGKLISPKNNITTVTVEEFSLQDKRWLPPFDVKVTLDRKPFASGSFRDAYKASVISGLPSSEKYVLKKFKTEQIADIERLFGTIEAHTRKMVQMNALARNLALKMSLDAPEEFGETFAYNKLYFGKVDKAVVTLERFLEGKFVKHINNTGEIYCETGDEIGMKCEAFVHYTYAFTNKQLMVVDIQGVGFQLCDPEIASCILKDETDDSILFCTGNLSTVAIEEFVKRHICNKYCDLLKLQDFILPEKSHEVE